MGVLVLDFRFILSTLLLTFATTGMAKKSSLVKKSKRTAEQWRVGLGVGIPHPWELAVAYKKKNFHIEGSLGQYQSKFVTNNKRELDFKIQHLQAHSRLHPFKDPFFVGVDVGYQRISLDGQSPVKVDVDGVVAEISVAANMDITALYWTPQVGMEWRNKSIFWGFSVGYLVPVVADSRFEANIEDDNVINETLQSVQSYRDYIEDVRVAGKQVGLLGLPSIKLLELGIII